MVDVRNIDGMFCTMYNVERVEYYDIIRLASVQNKRPVVYYKILMSVLAHTQTVVYEGMKTSPKYALCSLGLRSGLGTSTQITKFRVSFHHFQQIFLHCHTGGIFTHAFRA